MIIFSKKRESKLNSSFYPSLFIPALFTSQHYFESRFYKNSNFYFNENFQFPNYYYLTFFFGFLFFTFLFVTRFQHFFRNFLTSLNNKTTVSYKNNFSKFLSFVSIIIWGIEYFLARFIPLAFGLLQTTNLIVIGKQ